MITPYDGYVDVCATLADLTPGDHAKKSALFNSGAEAVENAVKIARVSTGRDAVAVFDHAYHGRTNLTMAMTAKNMPYKQGFGPFAGEVYRAPMSYPLRDELSGEQAAARAIDHLDKQVGAGNLACVAIEPIQGEGGFVVPAPGFLPAIAEWCTANGMLLHRRRDPDRLLPHRRLVRERPRGRRPRPDHHRQGHRRRPAAGRGHRPRRGDGQRARRRPRRHVRRQPGRLRGGARRRSRRCAPTTWPAGPARSARGCRRHLESIAAAHPVVAEIRGRGAMMAIELCAPGSITPDAARAAAVSAYCHSQGVVTLTCGTWGNVFRFLPPLSISDDLLDEAFGVVAEGFAATA